MNTFSIPGQTGNFIFGCPSSQLSAKWGPLNASVQYCRDVWRSSGELEWRPWCWEALTTRKAVRLIVVEIPLVPWLGFPGKIFQNQARIIKYANDRNICFVFPKRCQACLLCYIWRPVSLHLLCFSGHEIHANFPDLLANLSYWCIILCYFSVLFFM